MIISERFTALHCGGAARDRQASVEQCALDLFHRTPPNGCSKLIIPYENSIVSVANGRTQISYAQRMYFVGNRDSATHIRSSAQKTSFVAIEFRPHRAFQVFGVPMSETSNQLWETDCVFGQWSREMQEMLNYLERVDQKVACIQDRLAVMLRKNRRNASIVDYCVGALRSADGRIPIRELEQQTGYSRRYLDRLFQQHVGLSPKVLAEIFRFQRFYRKWADGVSFALLKAELYDHYYDQAHFTRAFRRMTGHSPQRFVREVSNEFGRRLVRQQASSRERRSTRSPPIGVARRSPVRFPFLQYRDEPNAENA